MLGNWRDWTRSFSTGPLAFGTTKYGRGWSQALGHWRSWLLLDDLDNAAQAAFTSNLPIFYHALLTANGAGPPSPKYACSKVRLRCHMVENQGSFAHNGAQVKCVLHQQDKINVIGVRLGSDE